MSVLKRKFGIWAILPLAVLGTACSGGGGDDSGAGGPGESGGSAISIEQDAAYPEAFSFLNGIREMPDGTLMAADPLGQVLLRLNMDTGAADTLGRVGEGPEEYRQPDQVFPLPGDSTLLLDLGNGRLTTVAPNGRFVEGMPIAQEPEGDGGGMMRLSVLLPRFLDAEGNIYHSGQRGMDADPPDSTVALRFNLTTKVADTVAILWQPELKVERSGNSISMIPTMLEGRDDWAVGADGKIAVIRANGYSVDWFYPDGRVVHGPSTPYDALSPTDADKEAALEEMSSGGLSMFMSMGGDGGMSMNMRRGGTAGFGGGDGPAVEDYQWAEVFPPFRDGRAQVSPMGEAWVERRNHFSEPTGVDVFDGEGIRIASVELPHGSKILGFGQGGNVVYSARMDEVGLWWLERYRIHR